MYRRPSSSAEDSFREPFVVEDSDDEPSFSENDGDGFRKHVIVDTDEVEEVTRRCVSPPLSQNSAGATSLESENECSTLFVGKLIRKSLERIAGESKAEASDDLSDNEDSKQLQPKVPNAVGSQGWLDENSNVKSEPEISEETLKKLDDVVQSPDKEHSEDPEIENIRDSSYNSILGESPVNLSFDIPSDPGLARKRANLISQQQQILESKLVKLKTLFWGKAMTLLPDCERKEKLRSWYVTCIASTEKALAEIKKESNELSMMVTTNSKPMSPPPRMIQIEDQMDQEVKPVSKQDSLETVPIQPAIKKSNRKLHRKAEETSEQKQALLQNLHDSLQPAEVEKIEDPRGLKVRLMPHQQYALAWLMSREKKKPRGGILADDMGLGKTLTMISLVIASISNGNDRDEDEKNSSGRNKRYLGGTLVVAPASAIAQWQYEVKNHCQDGLLTVALHHGKDREIVAEKLAKNDLVITTYKILMREFKTGQPIYEIHWKRVILDESHVIRNYKSQTCESVCALHANKRWAITGTQIENKKMDLYSILKFLQCSPFDKIQVWKQQIDNNPAGQETLVMVTKTLMLRRTKQELSAKKALQPLSMKIIETIEVDLDCEERLVYDKLMDYSQTLVAQFLTQCEDEDDMFEFEDGKCDEPSWNVIRRDTMSRKAKNKQSSMHGDVKSQVQFLLLRLRRFCCHPGLIQSMLDEEHVDLTRAGTGAADSNLSVRINKMKIKSDTEREAEHLLMSDNPVFATDYQSSKMSVVLRKIKEIIANDDKVVVVSQWLSVLEIIRHELKHIEKSKFRMFTGKKTAKDRLDVMNEFNDSGEKTNILLLLLSAAEVGTNLVGANHLVLVDIHWNPQLESQAQDLIYRFGQTKHVYIYKFICTDTVEETIQAIREKKLELAAAALSSNVNMEQSKLSLDDIKSLFSL